MICLYLKLIIRGSEKGIEESEDNRNEDEEEEEEAKEELNEVQTREVKGSSIKEAICSIEVLLKFMKSDGDLNQHCST